MAATPPPPSTRPSTPPVSSPPSGVVRATPSQPAPLSAPPSSAEHDSGIIDLKAAAASDPMAAARASQTPLASTGLFEEDERNSQPPPSLAPASQAPASQRAVGAPLSQPAPSKPSVAQAAPQSVPQLAPKETPKKRGGAALMGVGVVALAAIAAGAFFVVKQQAKHASQPVAITTPATPDVAKDTPAPVAAPTEAANAQPAAPAADDDKTDDTATTAKGAVGGGKAVALSKKGSGHYAPAGAKAGPAAANAPAQDAPVDPKLVAKDLPPAPPPVPGALGDAMKQAAGPASAPENAGGDKAPNAPDYAPGSVPQKPSQGSVTSAITQALPGARACLHTDDPVSRATITFGSNGGVSSVSVTGPAAGKPAEACIKSALGKAHVAPFAQPTYTASVTVRANN